MTRELKIKDEALEMRRSGKGYNEISKLLGVAKSTLSIWFRSSSEDFDAVKSENVARNRRESSEHLFEFTKERKRILFLKYDEAIRDAAAEFEKYRNEPLFVAGLALYIGEGDKVSRSHIRISNVEWRTHEIFIRFLEKYLLFPREKVRVQILGYPDHTVEDLVVYWSNKLSVPKEHFYKTQILPGKGRKKLQFGVGMSIISSTRAKYKLNTWMELLLEGLTAI